MSSRDTTSSLQTSINIRVGKKFREKYDKYLSEQDIPGAAFTRAALEYWMSVDGDPENIQQQLHDVTIENQLLRELLAEKERTISILQDQIQRLDGTHPSPLIHVNGNKNQTSAVVSEKNPSKMGREQ